MAGYQLITDSAGVSRLVERLRGEGLRRLAIDVEGENNLHRYGIHVALIQLHDGKQGYIVDPLAVRDPAALKPLLENAPWELVWFDAGNDLLSFQHALGIRPSPILDLVVAARLLGRNGGLHDLTGQPGSSRAKDKFQRANWLRRPLSPALLDYAISDVLHLHELADSLLAELEQKGLLEKFRQKNRETQDAERSWDPFANYTRIPGFGRMSRPDRRFAQVLWHARELYGKAHDLPPGNVASKQDMKSIVDKGLRRAADIAAFLNQHRERNRVVASDLERLLNEAERQVPQA
ncbi:MAG TPA: ribonuclease D [Spirochaetia bacterium]|nr:ribonuclease D [Spirochaetia bacterium]